MYRSDPSWIRPPRLHLSRRYALKVRRGGVGSHSNSQQFRPPVDKGTRPAPTPKVLKCGEHSVYKLMVCLKAPVFVGQNVPAPGVGPNMPALPQSDEDAGVPLRRPKPPLVFSENLARHNAFSKVFTLAPADRRHLPRSKSAFTSLHDPINPTFRVFGQQPESTSRAAFHHFTNNPK